MIPKRLFITEFIEFIHSWPVWLYIQRVFCKIWFENKMSLNLYSVSDGWFPGYGMWGVIQAMLELDDFIEDYRDEKVQGSCLWQEKPWHVFENNCLL